MLDRSKALHALLLAIVLSAATVTVTLADENPNGTGQPSQSCQAQTSGPPGLLSTTNGFARVAVNVYAGAPGSHSLVSGNTHVVSQYDVACYQVSH